MKALYRTVFLFTLVALSASHVFPCVCEAMKPDKKLRKAKAVFIGQVVEIGRNDKSDWATVAVRLKVERHWKGVRERFVTVVGAPGETGACGLPVEMGKKYLIYGFKMEAQLETSFCHSRWLGHAGEDLAVIGKGKELRLRP